MISDTDRTRVELSANRRRFRREGVPLIPGDPRTRHPLQIDSRCDITVRPAFRPSGEPEPVDMEFVSERIFNALQRPLFVACVALVLVAVAAAIYHAIAAR